MPPTAVTRQTQLEPRLWWIGFLALIIFCLAFFTRAAAKCGLSVPISDPILVRTILVSGALYVGVSLLHRFIIKRRRRKA